MPGKKYKKADSVGIGYVIIADDVSREDFILRCYDTCTVAVFIDGVGSVGDAMVDLGVMEKIKFPLKSGEFGSPVLYNKLSKHHKYVVTNVFKYSSDNISQSEYSFGSYKHLKGKSVSIMGDARSGIASVCVQAENGKVSISAPSKGSIIDILAEAVAKITAKTLSVSAYDSLEFLIHSGDDNSTEIKYVNGEGFSYSDGNGNQIFIKPDSIDIVPKKRLNLFGGDQSLLLGDKTIDWLGKFLDEVSKITVSTSIGVQPILNKVMIVKLKESLKDLLSKKSYTS